jgi:hypothetical protein
MIENMVKNGFLSAEYQKMLIVNGEIERVMETFATYVPPAQKWVAP